jgi:nucleotidyltransferase substrate binding protein (TIGR01987 family)
MAEQKDILWKQLFIDFSKALSRLEKFIERGDNLSELEVQGLVLAFEYNFDLAWNLIREYYEYQLPVEIQNSRDAISLALKRGLIVDDEGWMKMIESREETSQTYNEEITTAIASAVLTSYFVLFHDLYKTMQSIWTGQRDLFFDHF